ncbi:MAG: hypothetical protein F6K09_08775 [Merismopedia sp. SIO2A8]|nr:hypothetical protein [Symploca sp. SIO2B6]NET48804.1 hypothetical protein [Merismopedia sp. SIO2A8]
MVIHTRQLSLLTRLEPKVALDPGIVLISHPEWPHALNDWSQSKQFGFDIETYAEDDALDPWNGKLRLIQICLPDGRVLVADFGGWGEDKSKRLAQYAEFLSILKERLEHPKVIVIGHNIKFDALWMRVKFGIKAIALRDTMIMSQLKWTGISNYQHSLLHVAKRVLDINLDKSLQKSDFGWEITNDQLNYAAADARASFECYQILDEQLVEEGLDKQLRVECGAIPAFIDMEFRGFPVDKEHLDNVLTSFQSIEDEVLKDFKAIFPTVNPASSQEVKEALNDKYKVTLESTSVNELSLHSDHAPVRALLNWRSLRIYINYLQSLQKGWQDGAVRGKYRTLAPRGFGRSICAKPNLQQPPNFMVEDLAHYELPHLRSVFRAPPGYQLIVADLSQAHSRIAAQASADPVLIKGYRKGFDIHCITAQNLAKIQKLGEMWTAKNIGKWRKDKAHPNYEKAKLLRAVSKKVFYGSLNSQGWRTLQKTARADAGIQMSDQEAKDAIQAWRTTYQVLYQYQSQIQQEAQKQVYSFPGVQESFGKVRGLSGRRIFLPLVPSFLDRKKSEVKITDAVSFVWTSTEADIIKLALNGIWNEFQAHPEWDAHICNCVHDEIDCVVKDSYALQGAKAVLKWMHAAMKLFITDIPVDEPGSTPEQMLCKCWSEKK